MGEGDASRGERKGGDARSRARSGLLLSALAVAAGYATAFVSQPPPLVGAWLMALGTAGSLTSAMALGAARDGRLGPLGPVFLFVFLTLAGGFGAALVVGAPEGAAGELPLFLGLPAGAALSLYLVGVLPLLVVPLAYAATFDRMTLDQEDWERIREAARRRHGNRRADGARERETPEASPGTGAEAPGGGSP